VWSFYCSIGFLYLFIGLAVVGFESLCQLDKILVLFQICKEVEKRLKKFSIINILLEKKLLILFFFANFKLNKDMGNSFFVILRANMAFVMPF